MKATEYQIQCAIVEWLRVRAISGKFRFFHIPNGGSRHKAEAARLKKSGVMPGVPDLCVILQNGRTLWIEVKSSKGKLSADQNDLIDWLNASQRKGHFAYVVRDLYEIICIINEHLEA